MAVNIKGVDELAAVVPHLLGYQPTESLVVVPLRPGPPVARVDLPAPPTSVTLSVSSCSVPTVATRNRTRSWR